MVRFLAGNSGMDISVLASQLASCMRALTLLAIGRWRWKERRSPVALPEDETVSMQRRRKRGWMSA